MSHHTCVDQRTCQGMLDSRDQAIQFMAGERDKYRQALTRISSFAATCRVENTAEWMTMLVEHLNKTCETLNVTQRFKMGQTEIECINGSHEDYRG